jgi:ABC-type bacteriocin/lantibiotic exporter with double-glycine peptidase domain
MSTPTARSGRRLAAGGMVVGVVLIGVAIGATRQVGAPVAPAVTPLGDEGIVRQREVNDCGVAALIMLMHARGLDIDADDVFAAARVPRQGLSLPEMAALAEGHGVFLTPAARPRTTYADLTPPWIAHLSWNHYVVVEAAAGGRVIVADPRAGRLSYAAPVFIRAWSGYALIVTPRDGRPPDVLNAEP